MTTAPPLRRASLALGLAAVAGFAWAAWLKTLDDTWVKAGVVALQSIAVTLWASTARSAADRLRTSVVGVLAAWLSTVVVGVVMTFAILGDWEEGGLAAWVLVTGAYFTLPIAALTTLLVLAVAALQRRARA